MFETTLFVLQIIVGVLLVIAILLQAPEGGISPVFGGGGETYRSRRHVEKFLLIATIILASFLVIFSIALLFPQLR